MKTIIPRLFGVIKMKNNIELHRVYFIPKTCQDAQQRQSCIMTALIAFGAWGWQSEARSHSVARAVLAGL